ncbi:MAG: hypothetical protein OXH90_01715 [Paracoccaceae bacterium]|nr:hypothetical protein [Paracoccaceae bacterium]MDE2916076.1 hypothetical protein [Paracoccaceae bacterium]
MYQLPHQEFSGNGEGGIIYADWVELNILTQKMDSLSLSDVIASIAKNPLDNSESSEHRLDSEDSAGYWQSAEDTAESAFSEIKQRICWYGDRYPLRSERDLITASPSYDSNTVAKFLILLRSRHFYQCALGDDGNMAGQLFEELLPHILKCLLGINCDTAIRFGVAGGSRGNGLPNDTNDALTELSRKMNLSRGNLSNIRKDADLGADSIAWKPLGDSLCGKLITIGQATISEGEWIHKDPSPKWGNGRLFSSMLKPTIVASFVESISLTKNSQLNGLLSTKPKILLDRFRILFILKDTDIPSDLLNRMDEWSETMLHRIYQYEN